MKSLLRVSLLVAGLLWPVRSHAQFAALVWDPTNWSANIVTSAQSVITAGQMVIATANQARELLSLDEIALAATIAEDMAILRQMIEDAQGLLQDLTTLQALFDPYDIPRTLPAMRARISAMDAALFDAQSYALKAQTLLSTLLSTVRHVTGLITGLQALTGNMASNQTLAQIEATISKTLVVLTTHTAGHQRVETLERMRRQVLVEMDREITRQYYAPWFEVQR